MPDRNAPPRVVYDDDCGFCTWCVEFALERGDFEPVGFAELSPDQLARLPEGYESCTHLLTEDAVYSCGEAVEEMGCRLETPLRYLALAFRAAPGSGWIREPLYRFGANRRDVFGRLLRREPPARRDTTRS